MVVVVVGWFVYSIGVLVDFVSIVIVMDGIMIVIVIVAIFRVRLHYDVTFNTRCCLIVTCIHFRSKK